jgi:hypothetical protein
LTVNVLPATVRVPLRAGPVFGATSNLTEPSPRSLAPAVMVIHEALLLAVQSHWLLVETLTRLSLTPDAGTERLVGSIE